MKKSSVIKPIYRKNKELSGISDMDRGVVPLVKALNRWRKHAGGYYTGIATTFSCEGEAYVSFHSSRKQAEALADCVREFRQGKEWIVNFYTHTYELRSTDHNKDTRGSMAALTWHLKKHLRLVENDPGWRLYRMPDNLSVYSISDQNTYLDWEDYTTDFLTYLASHSGSLKRRKALGLMFSKYHDRAKVLRALERLKRYGLVSEGPGGVALTRGAKAFRALYLAARGKYKEEDIGPADAVRRAVSEARRGRGGYCGEETAEYAREMGR